MSDETIDALAETARNRGLKLVRSRVRTANKRRFGKVGLTDKSGKAVFGMDPKGPAAKPEDVESYLRNLGASDWGASLDVAVLPRKRKPTKVAPAPAHDSEPEPKAARTPKPKPAPPPPKPKLRDAKPSDAPRVTELIRELGHEIGEEDVRKNLKALKKSGEIPFLATLGDEVVGLIGRHLMVTVHRPRPVDRIPILIVAKDARKHGLGRMLVEAAEQWMRKQGCQLVEVTSNDSRAEAHAFYRHLGYERTSIRFFKKL